MTYVVLLLNHCVNGQGVIPNTAATGEFTDVSPFLEYHFWQEVFYENPEGGESLGRWCGPAPRHGDVLTYAILNVSTDQIVYRSNVRPAKDPMFPNRNVRPDLPSTRPRGTLAPPVDSEAELRPQVESFQDYFDQPVNLPVLSPDELIGLTFVRDTPDGDSVRAKVVRKIIEQDDTRETTLKFLLELGEGDVDEIIAYNELSDVISAQLAPTPESDAEPKFTFKKILAYEHVHPGHHRYLGSQWNLQILWDDGSITWEPLNMIGKDDPLSCARFAQEHDLLEKPGWKFLRKHARELRFANLAVMAAKRKGQHNQVKYKFGVRVPRHYHEAIRLDKENGNTYWQDAIRTELEKLNHYNTFKDMGYKADAPDGYTQVYITWSFDVKANGKRRARACLRGDLMPNDGSNYSSVASMRSVRIVTFLAELNGLPLKEADVSSAYLQALSRDKVYIRAGPDFGALEGHLLVIFKAMYGSPSAGLAWHACAAKALRDLGFVPSFADPDVWMRDAGNCWEYVVIYVDDLLVAVKDPDKFFDALKADPYNYDLSGECDLKYHLGADYFRDKDGTLCVGAQTYAKRLLQAYERLYGELPPKSTSAMEPDDRPELDTSRLCSPDETAKFHSLIGACQWMISLCRFDLQEAVLCLNRFRCAPRIGHLERLKNLCGYIRRVPHGAIRIRTHIPDHESIFGVEPERHDWMETVYGSPTEELPHNMPVPKGKVVRTSTFVDANLMHDVVTGRSATGIMHFLNGTPIDSTSQRQAQTETATYGSEFRAARTAVEQIVDLRYTLRMFGVALDGPSWLFGDNKAVVTSSTIPHSTLSKRWNALSYHRVRELCAANPSVLRFHFVPSEQNCADILTAHRPSSKTKHIVEPLLFWKGDTGSLSQGPFRGVTGG